MLKATLQKTMVMKWRCKKDDYYTKFSSGVAKMVNVTLYLKQNLVTKLKPFGLLQMSIVCLFHVHICFLFVRFLFIFL